MGKKLSHIRDIVAGGGPVQPPYNDQPIKQEIANLKQKDTQIENRITNLDRNNAKKNQNNTFSGTQTFEFAKVERVPGTDPKDIINWSVFDTRASRIETRVSALEQRPPGGGGQPPFDPTPLQQEDQRLQGEITKTNAKVATVEQTANNANQKATDNEQAISDLEQEDTTIKARITALENAPPQGGGINPGQPNTFTALQTFNAGISTNTVVVSGNANSDNNVVKHSQIKEYHKLSVTNNTVKTMESWLFKNKPLKYYSYAGNITIANGRARIISNVDSIFNLTFAIELNGAYYYGPFDNVAGNKTAVGVLENNVLEIRTINIANGIYGLKVELLFSEV